MYIDYYGSYLAMIRNSVGSHTWKNLFINFDNGSNKDILRGGEESCAFYVSSILKLFNLSGATFANVLSLEKHLLSYGRSPVDTELNPDEITPGSIIIRNKKSGTEKSDMFGNSRAMNYHIGFYAGNEEAISNYSDGFQDGKAIHKPLSPRKHHYTYNEERQIRSILSFPFFMSISDYITQSNNYFLMNKQLEIPFIGQTKQYLALYNFYGSDLDRALGTEEGLSLGRMCGGACIVMAYQYLTGKQDRVLKDILPYRDLTHEKGGYRNKEHGRYHDGLIAIATERGLSGVRGNVDNCNVDTLKELIADCIDNKKVLLLSVSPGFESNKKGGHLTVIRGYNRNGYDEELIINDPLDPKAEEGFSGAPISKKLLNIVNCWSGKYIIISKP